MLQRLIPLPCGWVTEAVLASWGLGALASRALTAIAWALVGVKQLACQAARTMSGQPAM